MKVQVKAKSIRNNKITQKGRFRRLIAVRLRKQPPMIKFIVYGTGFLYYKAVQGITSIPSLFRVSY